MLSELLIERICKIVYASLTLWDNPDLDAANWMDADADTRASIRSKVLAVMRDPRGGDAMFYNKWIEEREKEGWKFGKRYSEMQRIDPNMMAFDRLPTEVKNRERMLRAIVINASKV